MTDQSSIQLQDVSRAMGQLCTQISYANVKVPKYEECKDVYEFLSEFNIATSVLTLEQKLPLLAKSFNHSDIKCWYTTELQPMIESCKPWKEIRNKIIDRFTDIDDPDRHFNNLKELKFEPGKGKKLLNFAENFIYSYKQAYDNETSDTNCIRALKASLPKEVRNKLSDKPDFKQTESITKLKEVIKSYDLSLGFDTEPKPNTAGLEAVIQQLTSKIELMQSKIELIDKGNKDTKEAIKAAMVSRQDQIEDRMQIAAMNYNYGRQKAYSPSTSPKPYRRSHESHGHSSNDQYTKRRDSGSSREASPAREPRSQHKGQSHSHSDHRARSPELTRQDNKKSNEHKSSYRAFNDDKYWKRFGRPPRPCKGCSAWHWDIHCPDLHLK